MTIEERINELGEKYEKQKEINKDLADCNSRLLSQVAAATKRVIQLEKDDWHDLRKNPNDLPPKMVSNHNFSIEVLSDRGEIVCYNFHYCDWFYWRRGEPIAWCEIPQYKE